MIKDDHFPNVGFVCQAFLYSVRFLLTQPVCRALVCFRCHFANGANRLKLLTTPTVSHAHLSLLKFIFKTATRSYESHKWVQQIIESCQTYRCFLHSCNFFTLFPNFSIVIQQPCWECTAKIIAKGQSCDLSITPPTPRGDSIFKQFFDSWESHASYFKAK